MGTDTRAKLKSNPRILEVVEFLKTVDQISDVEIYDHKEREDFSFVKDGEKLTGTSEAYAMVGFMYDAENGKEPEGRQLFLTEDYCDKNEESSYPPFTPEHYMSLSLGAWGSSVEIMTLICETFGGIVIPSDCADSNSEDFFFIVNGTQDFVLSPIAQELFDSLTGINLVEKYKLVSHIENNHTQIANYLNSISV